jgi:3-hydroxyisobutyrate dehydrogenase
MKICHNTLVAEIQNGVNEMITVAQKFGISIDDFTTAISYGGAQNFYLDSKWKAIKDNNFTPAFTVENMYKDINIAGSLVQEMGLNLHGINVVLDVYKKAMEQELGQEDFCATFKVVNNQNGR